MITCFVLLLQPIADCSTELYAEHNETGRVSRIYYDQNCEVLFYWNPINNIHFTDVLKLSKNQ